jgi:hypothetical protein
MTVQIAPERVTSLPRNARPVSPEYAVACRAGFFLPVRVLSRLYRRRFLDEHDHFF